MITEIFFYSLSAITIVCSLLMVFHKNAMYSVLSLLAAFFALAGLYIMLNAQFLAIVHIIVYAGAIMVLFLYVIMFLNLSPTNTVTKNQVLRISAGITALMMCLILFVSIWKTSFGLSPKAYDQNIGYASTLGKVLFNEFLIPFELTSALFLSAMIGVVIFNKKESAND